MHEGAASGLLQYGAIGILALISVLAVWHLWRRTEASHAAEIAREVKRGDRMEAELMALYKLINTEMSGHLVRATEAMKEVTDSIRNEWRSR